MIRDRSTRSRSRQRRERRIPPPPRPVLAEFSSVPELLLLLLLSASRGLSVTVELPGRFATVGIGRPSGIDVRRDLLLLRRCWRLLASSAFSSRCGSLPGGAALNSRSSSWEADTTRKSNIQIRIQIRARGTYLEDTSSE